MYVFGYGSLLWNPNFPFEKAVPGVVYDYVRRFWQKSPDHRGTPEKPGRVVSLVPHKGGTAWGMAYKVPDEAVKRTIEYLDLRERAGYQRSQVKFWPDDSSEPFELDVYISLESEENIYFGPEDEESIVQQIIQCHGRSGSNLEYALRLADCQRRFAPDFVDEHLFGIETRLLELCHFMKHKDDILKKLRYKMDHPIENTETGHSIGKENVQGF